MERLWAAVGVGVPRRPQFCEICPEKKHCTNLTELYMEKFNRRFGVFGSWKGKIPVPCCCDSTGYCQDCENMAQSEICWFNHVAIEASFHRTLTATQTILSASAEGAKP